MQEEKKIKFEKTLELIRGKYDNFSYNKLKDSYNSFNDFKSDVLIFKKCDEEFLEKYYKLFTQRDWDSITCFQCLSIEFIKRHIAKLNMDLLCIYQELPEDFIIKHENEINWNYISNFQKLTPEFIDKYKNKLVESVLKRNGRLK